MSVLGNSLAALQRARRPVRVLEGPAAEFVTAEGRPWASLPVVGEAADGTPVVLLGSGATAPASCVRFTDDQGDVIAEFRAGENDRSTCED